MEVGKWNMGKYGPEKTPYLVTVYVAHVLLISYILLVSPFFLFNKNVVVFCNQNFESRNLSV